MGELVTNTLFLATQYAFSRTLPIRITMVLATRKPMWQTAKVFSFLKSRPAPAPHKTARPEKIAGKAYTIVKEKKHRGNGAEKI